MSAGAPGQLDLLSGLVCPTYAARPDDDFFATPRWLIDAIVRAMVGATAQPHGILDAGAGDGRIARALEARFGARYGVTAVELDPGRAATYPEHWETVCADFFEWARAEIRAPKKTRRCWSLIVTNPPFAKGSNHVWADWVRLCLLLLEPGGHLCVLGHGLLVTSEKRRAFWAAVEPSFYAWHPSPRRPSFTLDGQTDGRLWGWYCFRPPGPWSTWAPYLRPLKGVWEDEQPRTPVLGEGERG